MLIPLLSLPERLEHGRPAAIEGIPKEFLFN